MPDELIQETQLVSDTPEEQEFELRAHIGSIWSGGRLFIAMWTFLDASLIFSYFYLRSSNNGMLWRPNHVTAPTSYGWAIYALGLLVALMAFYGQARLRKGSILDWQIAGWVGVVAGLAALLLQIWEFTAVPFAPGSSGYSSTFIGYACINIGTLFVVTYWLETTVARSYRLSKGIGGDKPLMSMHPSAQSFRANVSSMTYFFGFIALASTLLFAMFYLL
jgi:heme/copper-type cytochrome/quinol oxidase subunit 3